MHQKTLWSDSDEGVTVARATLINPCLHMDKLGPAGFICGEVGSELADLSPSPTETTQ